MTCNITSTPLHPEPLPLYSRDDPDAISVRSAAPSYSSDTPTYSSNSCSPSITPQSNSSLLPPLADNHQPQGLPPALYAPGFRAPVSGSPADINLHNFNVSSWSSARTGNHSRQCNAVAKRRASQAAQTTAILNSLSAIPPPLSPSPMSASTATSTNSTAYPIEIGTPSEPQNPHEDPYLVGEEAADRARRARVYREMCLRGDEVRNHENRSWDFMLGQMSDWEERQRSWKGFRSRGKLLGGRLGMLGFRG